MELSTRDLSVMLRIAFPIQENRAGIREERVVGGKSEGIGGVGVGKGGRGY